jgi:hypothetical protein
MNMTKTEIIQELNRAHTSFWNAAELVPHTMINNCIDNKWSVAQNVEHINKTLEQFGKYLSLPREIIAAKFGNAQRPSDIAELLHKYHIAIAAGAKATAAFVPDTKCSYNLQTLITNGKTGLQQATNAIGNWDEADLDGLICPHPLLGPITVREMCLFIVHHVSHHQRAIGAMPVQKPGLNLHQ